MTNQVRHAAIGSFIIILFTAGLASKSQAQFWHALPPLSAGETANAGFSNDEKKVFYLTKDGSIENIWSRVIADKYNRIVAGPTNPPVQVTKFTDRGIARFFHLLNLPEIVYMRLTDNGKDYHVYRIKDDGSELQDLTPAPAGVTSEIIGASYNGRYVYYTENLVNRDKVDVYRYDTQQFISELVFPNDRDFKVLAWSRDHGRLLLEDPSSGELLLYDIISTERTPLVKPTTGKFSRAIIDPTNHELLVLEKEGENTVERSTQLSSIAFKDVAKGDFDWVDYSPNGKYVIVEEGKKWFVKEISTGTSIPLPEGAKPIAIAPKETLLLYSLSEAGSNKLFLYDIVKKASVELAVLK